MSSEPKPVVVGVDESPASSGALWWAVREARLRRTRLLVVHSASEAHPERSAEAVDDALRPRTWRAMPSARSS